VNTTVVYGFLGAGKTTLLRRLIPRLAAHEQTAILVNDFGKEGVDQIVMQTDDLKLVKIAGGCICCEVRGDLLVALDQLQRSLAPERLVIEPTGLAAPDTLAQVFRSLPIADFVRVDSVISILDATRFEAARQMFGEFFPQQTRVADIVLVNKSDLAAAGQVAEAKRWARELNPSAALVATEHCDLDPDLVLAVIASNQRAGALDSPAENGHAHDEGGGAAGNGATELSTVGLERGTITTAEVPSARLRAWLRDMAAGAFGAVVRAKGFVPRGNATELVDVVLGAVDIRPFGPAPARLEIIGRDLQLREMEQALTDGSTKFARPAHA
jgi:G3E family GTPase